ncbi:MAG: outer membrane protein assembly factor BamA, partial [Akkermansiaceae bacterium]|nr:outer membrane protein assembly factor BamA [Akkermansiaceae bacterium]
MGCPELASGQDFEGQEITKVEIRYRGPKTVDENVLRNFMSVRAGQKFSNEVLDNDIKSLYESGLVDDVRFLAEPRAGGLELIAEVVTRPALGGVGFVGNTYFKDKTLAKKTKLSAGGSLSDAEILEARRNIEEHYKGFGYPDVVVTHRMQETEREGFSDLIFVIDEGDKSEVRKIRFEGNQVFSDVELRREMKTKQKGPLSFLTKSGRINPQTLEEDIENVLDFYRNNGYLRANIEGVRRDPVKNGRVDLVIPVYEGVKYTVSSVAFGKMTVFSPEELTPALTLTAGSAYSAKKMRDDIRAIRSYYGSRGYADATVSPEIRDTGEGSIAVSYRITEGKRSRVGRVNIQGNIITQDRVVRREVPMKPGDWFNSVDLETTRRRLTNLNYFQDRTGVQVTGSPSSQAGYRDVNILVNEKKTGSISFGAGFSSIDNIVGYLNIEQTNFDIRNPRGGFRGGGQRFGMQLRLGAERRDFKISLVEPWFLGQRLALGGELYYRDLLFLSDVYEQGAVGGSVFIRKPIGRKGYVKGEYRLEQVSVDVDPVPVTSGFFVEDGEFIRSALELSYVYDSRDSNILPRKGHRASLGASLSGGILGGDVDTYGVEASGSKHWSLPWDLILNVSGAANVVDGISSGDMVPIFDRLFLGGSRNLRGYEFREVGPRDLAPPAGTGEVLGGKTSAYATAEVTFPIIENIRGAAFADAGFVSADEWDFSASTLHSDAGLGLRLNLPFGPL